MKSICIKQPFASLILHGKTWEVRSQRTHYRGPLLIVATAQPFTWQETEEMIPRRLQSLARSIYQPCGVSVAIVDVVDCIEIDTQPTTESEENSFTTRKYHSGRFAWVLENARPAANVPITGFQGWRDVDAGMQERVSALPTCARLGSNKLKVFIDGMFHEVRVPLHEIIRQITEYDPIPPTLVSAMEACLSRNSGRGFMARRLSSQTIETLKAGYCSFFGCSWDTLTGKDKHRHRVDARRKVALELTRRGYAVQEIADLFFKRSESMVRHCILNAGLEQGSASASIFMRLCNHMDSIMGAYLASPADLRDSPDIASAEFPSDH